MYVSKEAGYYEYKAYTKSKLTEEAIKKFENDIENGKDVSLKDFNGIEYIKGIVGTLKKLGLDLLSK